MFLIAVLAEMVAFSMWGITANIQETWIFCEISPFYFIAMRYTFATLLFLPFVLTFESGIMDTFRKYPSEIIFIGIINWLASSMYQVGTNFASGFSAAVWLACQPAITLLLAIYTGREKATACKSCGIVLVMVGIFAQSYIAYISFDSGASEDALHKTSTGFLFGQLCFLCYTIVFSFYAFQAKYMTNELAFSTLTLTFWGYVAAVPFTWVSWGVQIAFHLPYTFSFSKWVIYGLCISIVIGTGFAYTLFNFGNHYVESSLSVALGAFSPISSRCFSAIVVRTTNYPHWGLHDFCHGDLTLLIVLLGLTLLFLDGRSRYVEVVDEPDEEKVPLLPGAGISRKRA